MPAFFKYLIYMSIILLLYAESCSSRSQTATA